MSAHSSEFTPEKPRVLVVDDSRVVRISLKKMLGEEFDIIEAEDGEIGWSTLIADPQIQAVLTDAGMPRLDGYSLIERIRSHDDARIRLIPVNMITASDDEETRKRALGIGASDFITKPFDKEQLMARVRTQTRFNQTVRDLSDTSDALVEQATCDALTGVRSRRYLLMRGEQDLAYAIRHKQDLSVLVVALDNADALQAAHSNEAYEQILIALARTLLPAIRKEDTLARIDDSRFAIIAPTLNEREAHMVGNRIREKIAAEAVTFDDTEIQIKASLGLGNLTHDGKQYIEELLAIAEQHATNAQTAGGNRLLPSTTTASAQNKRISIDAALRILSHGDTEKLTPHLDTILEQLLPLLAFCNQERHWDAESELELIRKKAGLPQVLSEP